MKTFIYRGYERGGNRARGVIEALDLKDAREKLSRSGIFAETVSAASEDNRRSSSFRPSVTLKNVSTRADFYRALSALLAAGLPIGGAFDVLLDQPGEVGYPSLASIAGLRDRIRDGAGFVQAFSDAAIPLSPFEAAVIESGERTGRLADVLAQVADYLEDVAQIKQSLKTAAIYPLIVVGLAVIVGSGVLGFLVPQLASVFAESGMELPALTRFVVHLGRWFLPVLLPALLLVVLLSVIYFSRMRSDETRRIRWEKFMVKLPLVRRGYPLLVTARFARTCALLLQGGLPLVDTIGLSGRATGSAWIAGILKEKAESVRHGESFSRALSETPILGAHLSSWVKAGEATGDIPGLFQHAAQRYQQLWLHYIKRVVTFIEPALIIVVAVFVLILALAILLPILSLNQQLG